MEITVYRQAGKHTDKKMFMEDYLDYMANTREEDPYYMSRWRFPLTHPELLDHYHVPPHFHNWYAHLPPDKDPIWKWIYLGPAGSGIAMHVDFMCTAAWNMLFFGEKHWLFFGPDQNERVYEGKVDAFDPDLERYPRFAEAVGYFCRQKPGDILFTPPGWWHQVSNKSTALAVTENFVNHTNYRWLEAESHLEREMTSLENLLPYIRTIDPDYSPRILVRQPD